MGAVLLSLVTIVGVGAAGFAQGAPEPSTEVGAARPVPVRAFVQAGSGVTELAHAEVGVFLGAHLTAEAMVAWEAVFGAHYGGGLTYAVGHAQDRRPPRHALLVGARVMLSGAATFDTHGDDLSSYLVVPVGYGYLANSGFYLRATIGPAIVRERKTVAQTAPIGGTTTEHAWAVTGPLLNVAAGLAF